MISSRGSLADVLKSLFVGQVWVYVQSSHERWSHFGHQATHAAGEF